MTDTRTIDADELKKQIQKQAKFVREEGNKMWAGAFGAALYFINKCPTLDVSPVIRCKDCKHYRSYEDTWDCMRSGGLENAYPEDYCSYGERRGE